MESTEHTAPAPVRPVVRGRYGHIDGTAWPVNLTSTDDEDGLEWKLRYAPQRLTREDQLILASVVAAYVHLTDPNVGPTAARESLLRARLCAKEAASGS